MDQASSATHCFAWLFILAVSYRNVSTLSGSLYLAIVTRTALQVPFSASNPSPAKTLSAIGPALQCTGALCVPQSLRLGRIVTT